MGGWRYCNPWADGSASWQLTVWSGWVLLTWPPAHFGRWHGAKANGASLRVAGLGGPPLRLVRPLGHSVVWIEDGGASKGATEVMLAPERIMELFGPLRDTE